MAKERGIFQIIWKSFISSLKPRFASRKLVGEDYFGTKYYEEEIRYSSRTRPPRYFIPINKHDFTQELPAEWESWLRYRRQKPPTQAEIEASYRLAATKKAKAAALEEKFSNKITKEFPLSSASSVGEFPKYEEYRNHGSNYKPTKNE